MDTATIIAILGIAITIVIYLLNLYSRKQHADNAVKEKLGMESKYVGTYYHHEEVDGKEQLIAKAEIWHGQDDRLRIDVWTYWNAQANNPLDPPQHWSGPIDLETAERGMVVYTLHRHRPPKQVNGQKYVWFTTERGKRIVNMEEVDDKSRREPFIESD
jgi:hypothetical protein